MTSAIPDHVPPELVVDLDIYNLPGADQDAHLAWKQFFGRGPLVYTPRNGGHWVAAQGFAVAAMFRNPKIFSSLEVGIPDHGGERLLPIEADGADHAAYRATVMPFFSPQVVKEMQPKVRELVISLIEGLRDKGECEFISGFSEQLPLIVFLEAMGLPIEDRAWLHDVNTRFLRNPDIAEKQRAMADFGGYIREHIAERQVRPGSDAISALLQSEVHGRKLTTSEVASISTLLMTGGLDTVPNSLGFWALHFARQPEHRHYVRANRNRLMPVLNELLRRFPISNPGRIVSEDSEYESVVLKKGDRVQLSPTIHNLDDAIFPQAEMVDFGRPPNHITFGSGPHTCVGALLARSELTLFLEEWFDRIPDFEVKPNTIPRMNAGPTNSLQELWLTWS